MKCDLDSGSTHRAVQYAKNCIILLEMMQLSGLVRQVQSSEWRVFWTEAPDYGQRCNEHRLPILCNSNFFF